MAHSIGPKAIPASLRKILGGGENWRASGDAARDRKDWAEAAMRYRKHLESRPSDAAIWVQLGHALKEDRNFDAAESAYKEAARLTPDDADVHLQLGHLLKIIGRTGDAIDSYATSARLQPSSPAATEMAALQQRIASPKHHSLVTPQNMREASLPRPSAPASISGTGRVYLPVDDLMVYLHHHRTVSGIQRVQLNLFAYILSLPEARDHYAFMFSGPARELRMIPTGRMAALVEACGDQGADHDAIRALIVAAKDHGEAIRLRPVDTCFIVGSFWNPSGNPDVLSQIKQSKARLGIYFHDLIPVTHREYVVSELSAGFAQALVEALSFVDFAFGNSDYTTKVVSDFVADSKLRPFPIATVRLAHGQLAPDSDQGLDADGLEFGAGLLDEPFVLCVGTIEARKNHRYLFDVWKALVAEGIEPPKLVIVGRQGWRVDDLMAQFEATRFLDGRIEVLNDVSDAGLDMLYRKCLFTVFPSMVEGWGLPVGESLSHGKLCVASNTTSIPEVGGDLVAYFDPWNLRSGIDVVRRLLNNPGELAEREAAIKTRFKPRSWADFGEDLTEGIANSSKAVAASSGFVPVLPSGVLFKPFAFSLQHPHRFETAAERQRRLIMAGNWGICEDFGAWMAGRTSRLVFRSDVPTGTAITIYLHLALTVTDLKNDLSVDSGDGPPLVIALPGHEARSTIRVPVRVGTDGVVTLTLSVIGPMKQLSDQDNRLLRVGLISLSYAAISDSVSRAEILESLLIGTGAVMH